MYLLVRHPNVESPPWCWHTLLELWVPSFLPGRGDGGLLMPRFILVGTKVKAEIATTQTRTADLDLWMDKLLDHFEIMNHRFLEFALDRISNQGGIVVARAPAKGVACAPEFCVACAPGSWPASGLCLGFCEPPAEIVRQRALADQLARAGRARVSGCADHYLRSG